MALQFEIRETEAVLTGRTDASALLEVPAERDGVPVTTIAPHAFEKDAALREVRLPDTIRTIGAFAFHNCPALARLSLSDSVTNVLDGAIRMCDVLREIHVDCRRGDYTAVRALLNDADTELHMSLLLPDGEAKLVFPGFVYDFTENTMARTIQFNIDGSGMAVRECVTKKKIDFAEYDRLFGRVMNDDIAIVTDVALARLTCPYALSEGARERFVGGLQSRALRILKTLIDRADAQGVRTVLTCARPAREVIAEASLYASERGQTKIVALLMQEGKETAGGFSAMTL